MFEKLIIGFLLSIPLGVVCSLAILYFTRKSRSEKGDVVDLNRMSWFRQNIYVLFFLSLTIAVVGYILLGKN